MTGTTVFESWFSLLSSNSTGQSVVGRKTVCDMYVTFYMYVVGMLRGSESCC